MTMATTIGCIFVYGTLKRGQCRERSWPRQPLSVEPAWTLGRLYDLGPYPALVAGDDRVRGELWRFAAEDLPETLRVLDGIEGFRNQPGDLYRRVVAECMTKAGQVANAFTYRYARPLPASVRTIPPHVSGYCAWNG